MRVAGCLILVFISMVAVPLWAEDSTSAIGELSLAFGPSIPRAGFLADDDPGLNIGLGLNGRIRRFPQLSLRIGLNGDFVPADEFLIPVDDDGFAAVGIERVTMYYFTGSIGLQLGCPDRTRFFRPHVGFAPTLHLSFNSNLISVKDTGRELLREDRLQVRLGARATVGADFFPSPTWGLSLDFIQDWALNLDRPMRYDATRGFLSESTTARFYSVMVGLVLPFETLRGSSGN